MSTVRRPGAAIGGHAILALLGLVTVLPLVSMFLTALQRRGSNVDGLSVPRHPQWHNFVDAWNTADMLVLLKSSLIIVVGVVPISLLLATWAGYGLSKLPFPGQGVVYGAFIVGLVLPFEALIAPLYFQVRDMGLLNARWAVILPLIALYMPFGVFWMRSHFDGLPRELTEASRIDGASEWQTFRLVHVRLAAPAWSSLAILLFLWTWNQFILALVLIDDPHKRTMAGALGAFQGQYSTDNVLLCAGAILIMLPTILVFVLFQRSFVKALLQGTGR